TTNDSDENPFNFPISGTVDAANTGGGGGGGTGGGTGALPPLPPIDSEVPSDGGGTPTACELSICNENL
ncbi:hypothetical protein, partial [Phormidium sp. CCY1219]|uniref:hypothetical protein n=1 Tax=Phormidium sp. CCY1219 TaxID=2886104 RepID=UPI002D1E61AF